VFVGKGFCRPAGAGCSWGTEPSAHALGYRLSALRAWGRGVGGREAAEVHRDRTRFFFLSFRYRSRYRSRYRRVRRGFAGRVHRPPGACRVGMLGMATTDTLAALRLCGLSGSYSGALSRGVAAIGCWRSGERDLSPPPGLGVHGGRNPALTRWAIVCRPSGPKATALEGARLPRCIGIGPGSSF
jgi:hypothetical protein